MPDHLLHYAESDMDLNFIIMRYSWLWRLMVFTERSTIQLDCGWEHERETRWSLNRREPAEPLIQPRLVRFVDRVGCLHTTLDSVPDILSYGQTDGNGPVTVLRYHCAIGAAAFAFSDDSFRFEALDLATGIADVSTR